MFRIAGPPGEGGGRLWGSGFRTPAFGTGA